MRTVKELLEACEEQIAKGNGDKKVYISRDTEDNGFHHLYYLFQDNPSVIKDFDVEGLDESQKEDIVLLG